MKGTKGQFIPDGSSNLPTQPGHYAGEVVYIFAFDIAYEMSPQPVASLLGVPVEPLRFDADRRTPKHPSFYQPQMVRLPAEARRGPHGSVLLQRVIKLLPLGAISITVRVPFTVQHLEDLVVYHDLQLDQGSLNDEVCNLAEAIRKELAASCVRPVDRMHDEEAYTVFCFDAPLATSGGQPINAEDWLREHRRDVAALLTQESNVDDLSRQEADESTSRHLSYYQNDLVVIDWDAALIVDEKPDVDEALYIMELANLQLAELEAYDRLIDASLDRAYRDLRQRSYRSSMATLEGLREIRIDLARLRDELENITKFFGDWHLARVYEAIAARFHLSDWHRTLDEKLKTLDGLYEILKHDQNNRWMLVLEATIVLLFIIDLAMLFWK